MSVTIQFLWNIKSKRKMNITKLSLLNQLYIYTFVYNKKNVRVLRKLKLYNLDMYNTYLQIFLTNSFDKYFIHIRVNF